MQRKLRILYNQYSTVSFISDAADNIRLVRCATKGINVSVYVQNSDESDEVAVELLIGFCVLFRKLFCY